MAVVVEIDEFGHVVLHDLGEEDPVREVARNVALGPAEGDLVHPVVDGLQVLLRDVFGVELQPWLLLLLLQLHLHEHLRGQLVLRELLLLEREAALAARQLLTLHLHLLVQLLVVVHFAIQID
mgnify:CR=1 FL=1